MTYSALNPELVVSDPKKAFEWYGKVLNAKLEFEYKGDDGKIMHSMLRLPNNCTFFVVDDYPEHNDGKSKVRTQQEGANNNACVTISVEDGAELFQRAAEHGALVTMPFEKQFWGATYGRFVDPFGHEWAIDHKDSPADGPTDSLAAKGADKKPAAVNGHEEVAEGKAHNDTENVKKPAAVNGHEDVAEGKAHLDTENVSGKHVDNQAEGPDAKKQKVEP